ncbi:MAG TPA: helix-turn-helix domain-containing protein [Streptosporangiaceae bacterium]
MPSVDEILASPPLSGLRRVSHGGGDRQVVAVRLAEDFSDLNPAPAGSLVVLSRAASAAATDYRLDMALRWAAIHSVAAVAAFSAERWQPPVTAADIAERAGIALVSVPASTELTWLIQAIMRETGGGAEQALARAEQGLAAVLRAVETGADLDGLRLAVSHALGTGVELRLFAEGEARPAGAASANGHAGAVSVPIIVGDTVTGELTARDAHGDLAVAASLVLRAAASSAGRLLDLARHARELPIRSRSELIAELLMSDAPLGEDLRGRAMHLAVPIGGWHVAVRIEAENLDEAGRDEVHRFELLETAGQAALQATARTGGSWYLSRVARAIVLVRMTSSHPGAQAGMRAARSAEAALAAVGGRLPGLRLRGGVGTPHEGPMGLRASAAEARIALVAARSAGKPEGVATHDATGVQRMLMEWYASDTAQASVRAQLAPLERLGPARGETAIRTLAAYLDQQGSIVRTATVLHLHRNAVTYRLRRITDLLGVDLDDPDQRLALQLACRARLLA